VDKVASLEIKHAVDFMIPPQQVDVLGEDELQSEKEKENAAGRGPATDVVPRKTYERCEG
jgi:hypothetical protein